MSNYEGDPKLFIDENGSYLKFENGQPVMDQGFENFALIQLLTDRGWVGNVLLSPEEQIGSDFMAESRKSITKSNLEDRRKAALAAFDRSYFGEKEIIINNEKGNTVVSEIVIKPPTRNYTKLKLIQNGLNWIFQKENPANKR